jgi:hypothetical protein
MPNPVNDETALEEVMSFLDHPPMPGSSDDVVFGQRLRQVLAALVVDDDSDQAEAAPPRLSIPDALKRRLDYAAHQKAMKHPFGENPDGLGPTLGMNLGKH